VARAQAKKKAGCAREEPEGPGCGLLRATWPKEKQVRTRDQKQFKGTTEARGTG